MDHQEAICQKRKRTEEDMSLEDDPEYFQSTFSDSKNNMKNQYGSAIFNHYFNLNLVFIPENVEDYPFIGPTGSKPLVISDSVLSIDDNAFSSNSSLVPNTIQDSITTLDDESFCSYDDVQQVAPPYHFFHRLPGHILPSSK